MADKPLNPFNVPLDGKLITGVEPGLVGKNFRKLQNMRYVENGLNPQGIPGMQKIGQTSYTSLPEEEESITGQYLYACFSDWPGSYTFWRVICLNPTTGTTVWDVSKEITSSGIQALPFPISIKADASGVYVHGAYRDNDTYVWGGRLEKRNSLTGALIWEFHYTTHAPDSYKAHQMDIDDTYIYFVYSDFSSGSIATTLVKHLKSDGSFVDSVTLYSSGEGYEILVDPTDTYLYLTFQKYGTYAACSTWGCHVEKRNKDLSVVTSINTCTEGKESYLYGGSFDSTNVYFTGRRRTNSVPTPPYKAWYLEKRDLDLNSIWGVTEPTQDHQYLSYGAVCNSFQSPYLYIAGFGIVGTYPSFRYPPLIGRYEVTTGTLVGSLVNLDTLPNPDGAIEGLVSDTSGAYCMYRAKHSYPYVLNYIEKISLDLNSSLWKNPYPDMYVSYGYYHRIALAK